MNCLSINIRGIGGCGKSDWIKRLKNELGISFMGIQETMVQNIKASSISNYLGGLGFDFESVDAVGNSGGLVSIWDPKVFSKDSVVKDSSFLHVSGLISNGSIRLNLINVYAPQNAVEKRNLWSRISQSIRSGNGWWIVFGDFNSVRVREERKNSAFDPGSARDFNDFIDEAGLREYDLKGMKYTYMVNRSGCCKWSRIDRVLVSDNVFNKWPNACVRALNRNLSDHSPIVFSVVDTNFGPKPFRFFDSWLDRPGCVEVVHSVLQGWVDSGRHDINLLNKLKRLRGVLRDWYRSCSANEVEEVSRIQKEKEEMEAQMESSDVDESDLWVWIECKNALEELELHKARDLRQKSRVKWASLGDEN